jgi:uncharacterized membrane protein YkoI
VEDFKEIQFSVQKLNDDTKRFSDQIELLKARVEEVIAKERNCDYIHQLNAQQQQHNKEPQKTIWTFEKIISIAPNIIAVISFVGYLCYLAFMDRVKHGGL